MIMQNLIETELAVLLPHYLCVENESARHHVLPNSETHFKITIVSAQFEGKRGLERHRMVNEILTPKVAGKVHALAMHLMTASEWRVRGGVAPNSPPCMGGGR